MVKKQKTLTKDGTGTGAVRMLEQEFIRQMMDVYRADHPASTQPDDALYERMRQKFRVAFPRGAFNTLDNLPTAKALDLALRDKMEEAGALLEAHYRQQKLVEQGQIQGRRSKAGNDAQAMEWLNALTPGHPLKEARDITERNRLIHEEADRLSKAHPNLRRPDIKRRVADWAQMSPKQIGRILKAAEK